VNTFVPHLETLPPAQREFLPLAHQVPGSFVLYGGTALALRLGHRQSLDFDFFSARHFTLLELEASIPFLQGAQPLQAKPDTLTVRLRRPAGITVSFFGGLTIAQAGEPEWDSDERVLVASLPDLAATKFAVLPQRAEAKDYLDAAAILQAGIALPQALAYARAVYGERFNPLFCLKALSYFADGDLPSLPRKVQNLLTKAAAQVTDIPEIKPRSNSITTKVP